MAPIPHASQTNTKRLIILAQFDPDGGLPEHVRIHLERLADISTKRVLVSNSPMHEKARIAAEEVSEKVIIRPNTGWDFAAWRDALAEENMDEWDHVILTNSSVVGPLYPLCPIVEKMEAEGPNFWGMVLSHQHTRHLQSYFLAFDKAVILSSAWQEWWSSVHDITDKQKVIEAYELGFTKWLTDAGFTFSAVAPELKFPSSLRFFSRVRPTGLLKGLPAFFVRDARRANRSVEFSEELIREGMPYLKASLLWGIDTDFLKDLDEIKRIDGVDYPWRQIGF